MAKSKEEKKKAAPKKKKKVQSPTGIPAREVVEVDASSVIARQIVSCSPQDLAAEAQDLLNAAQITMMAGGVPARLLTEGAFDAINEKLAGIRG